MIVLLVLIASYLQYALWLGKGGILYVSELEQSVVKGKSELDQLQQKNSVLAADVADLKEGGEAIEERARNEMGMIEACFWEDIISIMWGCYEDNLGMISA